VLGLEVAVTGAAGGATVAAAVVGELILDRSGGDGAAVVVAEDGRVALRGESSATGVVRATLSTGVARTGNGVVGVGLILAMVGL
jgi:hypothetical protein